MCEPKPTHRARLACFMHAASVNPEPGSNSPKKRSHPACAGRIRTLTRPAWNPAQSAGPRAFAESRLHSSIVKDLTALRTGRGTERGDSGRGPSPSGQLADCTAGGPRRQCGGRRQRAEPLPPRPRMIPDRPVCEPSGAGGGSAAPPRGGTRGRPVAVRGGVRRCGEVLGGLPETYRRSTEA